MCRHGPTHSDRPEDGIYVQCYSFEEVYAEKIRALAERERPRDLYDVVHLHRHDSMRTNRELMSGSYPYRLSENCHSEASAEETRSITDCYYEILRFTQNDKINILQILGQPVYL